VDSEPGGSKIEMKRRWNLSLWSGFLFALVALFSYLFFAQYPVTRDFPWANLLLFAIAGILLVIGLARAFGNPKAYRGKIFGPIFMVVSLAAFGLLAYPLFYVVRQMPVSAGAPHIGEKAPEFTLPDQNGKPAALYDLLANSNGVLLIFYRGHW
jgi:hypothetical protein